MSFLVYFLKKHIIECVFQTLFGIDQTRKAFLVYPHIFIEQTAIYALDNAMKVYLI